MCRNVVDMKIWLAGHWYSLPDHVLIVSLTERDRKNIANMPKNYGLYCEYDEKVFTTEEVKKLLVRLKKESRRMKK